jgi:hypothetical protein
MSGLRLVDVSYGMASAIPNSNFIPTTIGRCLYLNPLRASIRKYVDSLRYSLSLAEHQSELLVTLVFVGCFTC